MTSTLEAFELIQLAEQLHSRLAEAAPTLDAAGRAACEGEWLAMARTLLAEALDGCRGPLEAARPLPEMQQVRDEAEPELIGAWVDALEHLHAEIVANAGPRNPILEALFSQIRFPALRRASYEAVAGQAREIARRLQSGYVARLLGMEEFAFARPALESVEAAFRRVVENRSVCSLSPAEAGFVRERLRAAVAPIEERTNQARLLAQAALLPVAGEFERLGLAARPRKRMGRSQAEARGEAAVAAGPAEAVASAGPAEAVASAGPAEAATSSGVVEHGSPAAGAAEDGAAGAAATREEAAPGPAAEVGWPRTEPAITLEDAPPGLAPEAQPEPQGASATKADAPEVPSKAPDIRPRRTRRRTGAESVTRSS